MEVEKDFSQVQSEVIIFALRWKGFARLYLLDWVMLLYLLDMYFLD